MADLSVKFAGVHFKNPVLLASAEPTFNYEAMKKGIDQGIGGLVAKSYANAELLRAMYKKPEMALVDEGQHERVMGKIPKMYTHISRSCFTREELDEWVQVLDRVAHYGREKNAVVIGSVAGDTPDSWVYIARRLEEAGVGMLELNFGCPHYTGGQMGGPVGQNDDLATRLVRAVKQQVSVPVIVKETPQLSDMVASVRKIREAGADAVTLTNRFNGIMIDLEEGKPYIHGLGGCGGPWVKPFSLRAIYQVATAMDIPIAGSNGVNDWRDALEYMMVGSTTVQICTAVMVHGYGLLAETIRGMSEWLDRKGYASVREIIGMANPHVLPYSEIVKIPPERYWLDEDKCIQCGCCEDACFYEAFAWEGDQPRITDKCKGCGFCQSLCPEGAIVPV
jgi:dihydroorotate dehydrogenase (fumarate)/dihydropyrimidine dehydrogenase (NAD+) subunit PreA